VRTPGGTVLEGLRRGGALRGHEGAFAEPPGGRGAVLVGSRPPDTPALAPSGLAAAVVSGGFGHEAVEVVL